MDNWIRAWQIFLESRGSIALREALFRRIWERYHKRILLFIRQSAPNDAEDLMQDVMISVFENLDRYNPVFSFETWIFAIARNRTINWSKKKKPGSLVMEDTVPDPEADTIEDGLIRDEIRRKIDVALNKLEPEPKQMAYLYYFEGLKIRQLAKVFECPAGTVKSRLFGIRDVLRQELGEYYED